MSTSAPVPAPPGATGGRVLVVGDPAPAVPAAASPADAFANAGELPRELSCADVVVLDGDDAGRAHDTIEELASRAPSSRPHVVVVGDFDKPAIEAWILLGAVHLVSTRGASAEVDLAATIEKLRTRGTSGLHRYFDPSATASRFLCKSATHRDQLIEWVAAFTARHRIRRAVVDTLLVVADEMVTNALYNAPVDASGAHTNAAIARTTKVELEGDAVIEVELRCDRGRLGISTTDPFGSLTPQVVLGSLGRCFERASPRVGTAGAGLGLYMFVSSVSHAIFDLAPGRRTEVIGLLDVSGGFRALVTSGKSFNLFVEP